MRLPDTYYGKVWSEPGIPLECQGFMLDGLRYSPGGSALPNRCMPFHPTSNNPYAVRCVDVWRDYKTGFAGDDLCILPPPPELGTQIGVHPQRAAWFAQVSTGDLSGYASPEDDWVMQPGEEETIDYRTSSDNEEPGKYYRVYYRTRPGSHHMGISAHDDPSTPREVWLPGSELPSQFDPQLGPLLASIGAVQRSDESIPVTHDRPAEDVGLYYPFPAGAAIVMNMHHYNFDSRALLKEVWVNVFWEADASLPVGKLAVVPVDQVFGLALAPGETIDLHYYWRIDEPRRVLRLFGHRHAWTPNFSAWVARAGGGEPEIVYQSFDWRDIPTYSYDSQTHNPAPNPTARTDGGRSGVFELQPGDELHFNCHITFTDARAAEVESPKTTREIGTLRFANEAYTAEMCSLLGNIVGPELPTNPAWATGELPSFATVQ